MSSAPPYRAATPVSAPPVVPAPALPAWPPSAELTTRRAGAERSAPSGRPAAGAAGTAYRGGPDLASTAYGGTDGPGFSTVSFPAGNPLDNSGSLTGHILAQGWADTPTSRSKTTRVVIVLAASLGLLVAISVLVVLLANDAMDGLVGGVLNK
ncbi:hypothetical protein V6U81_22505 [Micromonospora sp. CPCC 205711]|uniref:hypothetical protein n=1 Tax=Micromonospora sp. CPCC 205547 TaxID=3122400 RepID=UPI002FF15093